MHSDKKPYSCNYVTNVTFNSDRLGISNHTCESTVKKNLLHVINVTSSVSGLNKTRKHVVKTLKLKYYELRDFELFSQPVDNKYCRLTVNNSSPLLGL